MQTLTDMQTELTNRLMTANNSGLVPQTRITSVLQDSIIWAGNLFYWSPLNRLRTTTASKNTQNLNYDYYDYPTDFLTASISRLYIDGKKYEEKAFQDLLDYADSSIYPNLAPNPSNYFFANYGRQYFTFPSYSGTPPANNLLIWGNIQHPPVVNPTDMTIFSQWDDTGNDAIVKKALSVLLKRIDPGISEEEEQSAIGLLQVIWKKETDDQQKAQRLNHQLFAVPDYFGFGGGLSTIGNFNIPVDVENIEEGY